MKIKHLTLIAALAIGATACDNNKPEQTAEPAQQQETHLSDKYAEYTLTTDISHLSDNEREMLGLLFEAADIMDDLFWQENCGDREQLMDLIGDNADIRKLATIAYGPWDGLDGNRPFVEGIGPKPAGAMFYPIDMTDDEWNAFSDPNKTSQYTMIVRDADGNLKCVWYHDYFAEKIKKAASLLDDASELAGDEEFATYLKLRAKALRTDDYLESDMQWMDVLNNNIDMVVGPIENYTDARYGIKASYEAFVLLKDLDITESLREYTAMIPELQKSLPCPEEYKAFVPGSGSNIFAYNALYYAGGANAGIKVIAINLPHDTKVQAEKGTRTALLNNVIRDKFVKIVLPTGRLLIEKEQLPQLKESAFFWNIAFREVAHGLGVKQTVNGKGTVQEALGNEALTLEELKGDVLGVYLPIQLASQGRLDQTVTREAAITSFITGVIRSSRFGNAEALGRANIICYNFLKEQGAFTHNAAGLYHIDYDKAEAAISALAGQVLTIQATGDRDAANALIAGYGQVSESLAQDFAAINRASIPTDVRFQFVW